MDALSDALTERAAIALVRHVNDMDKEWIRLGLPRKEMVAHVDGCPMCQIASTYTGGPSWLAERGLAQRNDPHDR